MSKRDIDYSNTIIYKITCREKLVTDIYVGHTVDFVKRKNAHKLSCTHSKYKNHNCKVYQVIRANGGWTNWKMDIINVFDCKDLSEAKQKEQEYFISLNATLNSIEPFPTPTTVEQKCIIEPIVIKENFHCSLCKIKFNSKKAMDTHILTNKHIKKLTLIEQNTEDSILDIHKYNCEKCKFMCDRKPDWDRHNATPKHNRILNINSDVIRMYVCNVCCKEYKSNVGLWKHNKKCGIIQVTASKTDCDTELKQLIIEVLKSNNEVLKNNTEFHIKMSELFKTKT
jgi:hypothetical protein